MVCGVSAIYKARAQARVCSELLVALSPPSLRLKAKPLVPEAEARMDHGAPKS